MSTQHPVAGDRRVLAACVKFTNELGDVGGDLRDVYPLVLIMGSVSLPTQISAIPRMAEQIQGMLRQELAALVDRDLETVRVTARQGDWDPLQAGAPCASGAQSGSSS
jgi:phosphate uptake regulator